MAENQLTRRQFITLSGWAAAGILLKPRDVLANSLELNQPDQGEDLRTAAGEYAGARVYEDEIRKLVGTLPDFRGRRDIPLTFHQVRAGETVSSIAELYGLTQEVFTEAQLRATGNNDPTQLEVGASLLVAEKPKKAPYSWMKIGEVGTFIHPAYKQFTVSRSFLGERVQLNSQWQLDVPGADIKSTRMGWQLTNLPQAIFAHNGTLPGGAIDKLEAGQKVTTQRDYTSPENNWRVQERNVCYLGSTILRAGELEPDQLLLATCQPSSPGEAQKVLFVTLNRV